MHGSVCLRPSQTQPTGNALLCQYIDTLSNGRYRCVLPQDLEEPINRTVDIRNVDLKHVMTSDMAIFNFDGANLDSGTVVEFIYAKMLDVPCLLLRTDFRSAGEGTGPVEPDGFSLAEEPGSQTAWHGGVPEGKGRGKLAATINRLYRKMARQVVDGLDKVRQIPPLASAELVRTLYNWAIDCPGEGYKDLFKFGEVEQLLRDKADKALVTR